MKLYRNLGNGSFEDVTQRVHGDYERRLAELERRLLSASASRGDVDSARVVQLERDLPDHDSVREAEGEVIEAAA